MADKAIVGIREFRGQYACSGFQVLSLEELRELKQRKELPWMLQPGQEHLVEDPEHLDWLLENCSEQIEVKRWIRDEPEEPPKPRHSTKAKDPSTDKRRTRPRGDDGRYLTNEEREKAQSG